MRLEFDDAKRAPVPWDETVQLDSDSLEAPEIHDLGPIETKGELAFADPRFRLRGDLSYGQKLVCYRCLEPFDSEVAESFEYAVERTSEDNGAGRGDEVGGEEIELEDDDLDTVRVAGDSVLVEDFLREQVLLQVPMKPLCRPDCKGLCPECGVNRNETTCDCDTTVPDPRWAGLEGLKDQV